MLHRRPRLACCGCRRRSPLAGGAFDAPRPLASALSMLLQAALPLHRSSASLFSSLVCLPLSSPSTRRSSSSPESASAALRRWPRRSPSFTPLPAAAFSSASSSSHDGGSSAPPNFPPKRWTLPRSPYEVLKVPATASADEIKKTYYELSFRHHPDRTLAADEAGRQASHDAFVEIQAAYDLLSDTAARRDYDRHGGTSLYSDSASPSPYPSTSSAATTADPLDASTVRFLLPFAAMVAGAVLLSFAMTSEMRRRRARQERLAWQDWALARSLDGVGQDAFGTDSYAALRRAADAPSSPLPARPGPMDAADGATPPPLPLQSQPHPRVPRAYVPFYDPDVAHPVLVSRRPRPAGTAGTAGTAATDAASSDTAAAVTARQPAPSASLLASDTAA
ncbi:hypothetical protein HK405_009930 [Cladochytrium tenue]|nr:hypothetical protein HK405_009930 [Cladochytrium tenue]